MNASDRDLDVINYSDKIKWKFLLRQVLICSGIWTCYFVVGMCTGAPTVLVPQLRKEANSTAAVSEELASWLPAIFTCSEVPWVFILPVMTRYMGRRIPLFVVCVVTLLGFIVFFCSEKVIHIMISEVLQGALAAAFFSITVVIITEYTSSKYRGIFLTIKSASFFGGILASNSIGVFFHWKKIPLLGMICLLYCLTTIFLWPESPYWLAAKGRFEDCSAAHRWLKGSDDASENELEKLISFEQSNTRVKTKIRKNSISKFFQIILSKQFYKPIFLSLLVLGLYIFTGKVICTVYALEIINKITNSESKAHALMLILDGITVFCMCIGCGLAKLFKRRVILLITTSIGIGFMFLMSLYLYLIKLTFITENIYLSALLLSGYSISISCGPMIMSTSISGELLPLKARSISICIVALMFVTTIGTFMKVSPYIFKSLGIHGTFLLYGLMSLTCLILVYFYLPETKDKTLQEISNILMGIEPSNITECKKLMPLKDRETQISIVPAKKN